MRNSRVVDALPVQPHLGLSQVISSSPKIFMASFSERAGSEHFRWKLILCPPLGHAKTMRYALLIPKDNIFFRFWRIGGSGSRKSTLFMRVFELRVKRGEAKLKSPRLRNAAALVFCRIIFLETVPAVFYAKTAVGLRGYFNEIHWTFVRDAGLSRSARSLVGDEFFRHVVVACTFGEM